LKNVKELNLDSEEKISKIPNLWDTYCNGVIPHNMETYKTQDMIKESVNLCIANIKTGNVAINDSAYSNVNLNINQNCDALNKSEKEKQIQQEKKEQMLLNNNSNSSNEKNPQNPSNEKNPQNSSNSSNSSNPQNSSKWSDGKNLLDPTNELHLQLLNGEIVGYVVGGVFLFASFVGLIIVIYKRLNKK
jgi:hypothetical protein